MGIRCAIVDDEKLAREGLRILLQRCEIADLEVIGEARNAAEAESMIRRDRPDVLFLDINMPGPSGFQLLNNVDPDQCPLIVFVTAHPEHAVRGFDASAVDYLLKPVSDQRLAETLRRVRERITERNAVLSNRAMSQLLSSNPGASACDMREVLSHKQQCQAERILINDSGRRAIVDANDVVCIRAAGDYMCVTTRGGDFVCRTTLHKLMLTLGTQCIRVHRSAAVNPEFVREIVSIGRSRYRLVMDNGVALESSRRYRPSIRRIAAHPSG